MGFEEGRIVLDSDNGTYFPGQLLRGRLEFDLSKDKTFRGIYVDIKGSCEVHWTTRHSRRVNDRTEHYTVTHESYEEYMNTTIYLIGSKSGEQKLHPGHHVFPFECHIPPHCPSSFEGSEGRVRYQVKVVVDRAFKLDQTKLAAFRVIAPLDLNANPRCKEPIVMEFEQSFCCWCVSSGITETLVKLPAAGWCPQQVIPVEVACRNNSTVEIDKIKLSIKKYITFTAESEPDERTEEETIAVIKKGPIAANTTRNWTVDVEVPDMEVPNLDGCRFIDIYYRFRVDIIASGCNPDEDDSNEIFIGTIPLSNTQFPPTNAQIQGINAYPAQPVMSQPLMAANGAPYPMSNSPYPPRNVPNVQNIGFQTSPNPPYPTASPHPGPTPYPVSPNVASPPYPAIPNITSNPPYPATLNVGSNPPYPATPNVGSNPPYPATPNAGSNPPYPATPNVGSNPPYPATPNAGSNPPYPATPNAASNPPYPATPNVGSNPPYPATPNVGSNPPYPATPNVGSNPPYPATPNAGSNPPYPNTPNVGPNPPYVTSQHVTSNVPYPTPNNSTASPFPTNISTAPYPTTPGMGANPPYPYSPNVGANSLSQNSRVDANSPYPTSHSISSSVSQNAGSNLPFPATSVSYSSPGGMTSLKTGSIGFPGGHQAENSKMPLLPPTVMPVPASPFAAASAPAPSAPPTEDEK